MNNSKSLRTRIASLVHAQWAAWMKYQMNRYGWEDGHLLLDGEDMARWRRQACTSYSFLPEEEKESDLDWADKYLGVFEEWKGESSVECPPTWQVFISGDDRMYTVEADYYRIEEDGSLAFFKLEECDKPRPVGIVAPLSWALARRLG